METHHSPFESKSLNDSLHARNKFVAGLVNLFATFEVGPLQTIENKQRQECRPHQSSATKKKRTEHWIFTLLPIFGMKEPYTRVYSNPKPVKSLWIGDKTLRDGQLCHAACFCSRFKYLDVFNRASWTVLSYVPPKALLHP